MAERSCLKPISAGKNAKNVDKLAATIILQTHLDIHSNNARKEKEINYGKEKHLTFIDEDGMKFFEILFTFESKNSTKTTSCSSVGGDDDEIEVMAAAYIPEDGEGELLPIETEEEWQMIEEVLDQFSEKTSMMKILMKKISTTTKNAIVKMKTMIAVAIIKKENLRFRRLFNLS